MKTNPKNEAIANFFNFDFETDEFDLDGWGRVDFYCYHENILVLMEVDGSGQKHPNTNVLKLWPYLEENPEQKILLIHVIRSDNKAPKNRLALCGFTGEKLENNFISRFAYQFINGNPWDNPKVNEEIKKKLDSLA